MLLTKSIPILKSKSLPFREALLASGVMAFAGLGDALLYPVLPIYGESMGFSVFFIGILLSVNRFVRILTNTPIANYVNRLGIKKVLIISSILAVVTTIFYGLKLGAISFLVARIIWGLSYSGLKVATLNYAAGAKEKSALAFGFTKSIQTMGAFSALYIGPILIERMGIENGLFMIALISAIGIILALSLHSYDTRSNAPKVKTKKTFHPSPINLLVFILSITIDGILVVALSNLLLGNYSNMMQLLIGMSSYLLLKRLFVLVFSFASGFLTMKIPVIQLFNFSVSLCIIGTFLIAMAHIVAGIILVFLFNAVIVTFSPFIAIQRQLKGENSLQAISGTSTWWDLGAATGAFGGIYFIEQAGSQFLFLILSLLMVASFVNFIIHNAKTNRTTL